MNGIHFQNPKTWLWLGLLAVIFWLIQKAKRFSWLFALMILPGTLCHEACHYLAALILNGRPTRFSVWPKRMGKSLVLGTVQISHQRWYNVFFIGMAPLCMLFFAYHAFLWIQRHMTELGWPVFLWLYFVANLLYGAIPSFQDAKVAAKSPVGWVLLGIFIAYIWMRWV